MDNFDGDCIWISSGVLVIETVDIGHEKEVLGLDHGCCYGGEGVIVAEADFLDLFSQTLDIFLRGRRTETANVSFSFTMGMTPMLRSSTKVFWAFWY